MSQCELDSHDCGTSIATARTRTPRVWHLNRYGAKSGATITAFQSPQCEFDHQDTAIQSPQHILDRHDCGISNATAHTRLPRCRQPNRYGKYLVATTQHFHQRNASVLDLLLSALARRPSIARPTLAAKLRRPDRSGIHCRSFQIPKKPRSCSTRSGVRLERLVGRVGSLCSGSALCPSAFILVPLRPSYASIVSRLP